MSLVKRYTIAILITGCILSSPACRHSSSAHPADPVFEVMDHQRTGLDFSNSLHPTPDFNVLRYMYFYNGAGVGAGDFNGDGRIDVFFCANQGDDKLFLNDGSLHFSDVTKAAGIPQDGGWSTGVSVIDINNDGLLDIYVCKVGRLAGLPATHNQLLICQGIGKDGVPTYKDEAAQYGLDFSGFSSQAVFLDYDGDGDLDMYLLNHTLHQNGTYGPRNVKLASTNPLSGDRLYRNDGNNKFTDVTNVSGIHSSVLGYGLGIAVSDIDLDGYPDIYVGNDFHENDYLYINQHNGTFKDELDEEIMHTSQFSMGVDIADANNDGYPDIISMDMLPYDPVLLKRSEGQGSWDIFNMKLSYGYSPQYARNNLQFNRRNGHFSEIGVYSGVAATDWSWSALWTDFDNDGLKDLFISNGIPKRLTDIDFINYLSTQELTQKVDDNGLNQDDLRILDKFPEIKLPSKLFRNTGNMQFKDMGDRIEGAKAAYSNGTACADFDNDGDLDIVVNNINDPALLYRNTNNDNRKTPHADIHLKGSPKNVNALGAKVILFANGGIRTYEKFPVHGFLSSSEIPIHIGLDHTTIDSAFLVWPDNSFQRIQLTPGPSLLNFTWQPDLPRFDYSLVTTFWKDQSKPAQDITASSGLLHTHKENYFNEFEREPLLPRMLSTEGPALAVGDINKDGLDDVFIGGAKRQKRAVFLQNKAGRFSPMPEPALDNDSTYEDVDACWTDVDHDGNPDLVVASGGNEFYGEDSMLTPRVYLGNGKGKLTRRYQAFDRLFVNASCVIASDFNGDGFEDLFLGGRSIPFNYGQTPHSYLLANDGTGHFTDVTEKIAPGLASIGFVTRAIWFDLDKDGKKDLILSLEWGGIVAYMNHRGVFVKRVLTDKKGWWNFILPVDIDHDGHIDLIAGNLGLNSRLAASQDQPVRLYCYDFDGNGKKDQLLTYYVMGKQIPFACKTDLEKQLPQLRKKFLYAEDFAKADLKDIFNLNDLRKADTLSADYFSNALLLNDGKENFSLHPLPWEAQLSSYKDAAVLDINADGLPDILLMGNYYDNNVQMGRNDADYGTILLNQGHAKFKATPLKGLAIKGQVRHILPITVGGKASFILVKNNDSTRLIRFSQ